LPFPVQLLLTGGSGFVTEHEFGEVLSEDVVQSSFSKGAETIGSLASLVFGSGPIVDSLRASDLESRMSDIASMLTRIALARSVEAVPGLGFSGVPQVAGEIIETILEWLRQVFVLTDEEQRKILEEARRHFGEDVDIRPLSLLQFLEIVWAWIRFGKYFPPPIITVPDDPPIEIRLCIIGGTMARGWTGVVVTDDGRVVVFICIDPNELEAGLPPWIAAILAHEWLHVADILAGRDLNAYSRATADVKHAYLYIMVGLDLCTLICKEGKTKDLCDAYQDVMTTAAGFLRSAANEKRASADDANQRGDKEDAAEKNAEADALDKEADTTEHLRCPCCD
jgi:hypothetical protein